MPSQTRCHTYRPAAMGDGFLVGAQPRDEALDPGQPAMRRKREHWLISIDGSCGREEGWIIGKAKR